MDIKYATRTLFELISVLNTFKKICFREVSWYNGKNIGFRETWFPGLVLTFTSSMT